MKTTMTILLLIAATIDLYSQSPDDKYWFGFGKDLIKYNDPFNEKSVTIWKLFINNDEFFIAGRISDINNKYVGCIGRYNPRTKAWSDLDSGVGFYPNIPSPTVRDFAVLPNGEVFIGDGAYDDAGGPRGYMEYNTKIENGFGARFSGSSWTPYPTPNRDGRMVVTENGDLFLLYDKIYKWTGNTFQIVFNENIYFYYQDGYGQELVKAKGDLIYFRAWDSADNKQNWIKIYNTKTNSIDKVSLRGGSSTGSWSPNAFAIDNDGNIFLGGKFNRIIDVYVDNIAKWDKNTQKWVGLGNGLNGDVYALEIGINGELYAGGGFTQSGEKILNYVATWNGNNWDSLGSGVDGIAQFIEIDNSGRVYFGGSFNNAGGKTSQYIARWDKNAKLEKPLLIVNTNDDKFDRSCDDGHCSFRDALYVANLTSEKDTILFNINNGGEAIIELDSALPEIVYPIFIDGTSQPGYNLKPLIRIDGQKIFNYADGLGIKCGYSELKGLSITRFKGYGLFLYENGYNKVYSNFIGIDMKMTPGLENKNGGIKIFHKSTHNYIGDLDLLGNYIHGGVTIEDTSENSGNRIVNNTLEVPLERITNLPLRVPIDLGDDGPTCNCWEGCGIINKGIAPPRVLNLDKTRITGMSTPNALVEVYVAEELGEKHGRYFARKVFPTAYGYADGEGFFNIPIQFNNLNDEFKFVLTATDPEGNTSELSQAERPVFFAPGVGGSWLIAGDGTEIWLPDGATDATQNNNLFRMSLWPNGMTKEPITAPRIIESAGPGVSAVYGQLLSWLGDEGGYTDNPDDSLMNDIWRFPYDFRLDLENRADEFKNMIERATSENQKFARSCQVDILSHSMGGVIASLYIKNYPQDSKNKVNRLITLGTPYLGAVQAMAGHLKGYIFGLEETPIYGTGFDVRWDKMIEMSRNLTASYALAPSRKYWEASSQFDTEEYLLPDLYGNPLLSYDATRAFLGAPKYNPYYTPSETFSFGLNRNIGMLDQEENNVHNNKVDDWRSWNGPPQIFRIVGRLNDRKQAARYRSTPIFWYLNPRFFRDLYIVDIPEEERRFEPGDDQSPKSRTILYRSLLQPALGDGDGTVPMSSASLGSDKWTGKSDFSGADGNNWIEEIDVFPCTHTGLTEEDCSKYLTGEKIFDRIKQILKSASAINYNIIQPQMSSDKHEIIYITASAPVTVSVFDSESKHTGPLDNQNLNKIEYGVKDIGYWYNTYGATVMLPDLKDYKVTVNSPFKDAEVQFIRLLSTDSDNLKNVFYNDQIITKKSQIVYDYKKTIQNENSPIGIDNDRNGSIDKIINPSAILISQSSIPSIPIPQPFIFDIAGFVNEVKDEIRTVTIPSGGGPAWNWSLSDIPDWITADKLKGTSPADIKLTIKLSSLEPGLNTDTLDIELKIQNYTVNYPIIINANIHSDEEVSAIVIKPEFVMLNYNSEAQLEAVTYNQKGEILNENIIWVATGGEISQSGLYKSYNTPGVFRIIASDISRTISDTIEVVIDNSVAVNESNGSDEITARPLVYVYPNPLEDQLNMKIFSDTDYNLKIHIADLIGEKIQLSEKTEISSGINELNYNLADHRSGFYFLILEFSDIMNNNIFRISRKILKY